MKPHGPSPGTGIASPSQALPGRYTHNYREFMGGFTEWVETVADSGGARAYRQQISDDESSSMWQSLSFGANYKAAYCMAVCPAGEDVIGPYLESKSTHLKEVVRPLQHKAARVYVLAHSDAEAHVARRFPNKTTKRVKGSLRPRDIEGFLSGLHLTFNPGQARNLSATYHFTFTGREEAMATVRITDGTLEVERGHVGKPNLRVQADSDTWLRFLRKDASLLWALITRTIRLRRAPTLLVAFGRCFPS